MYASGTNDRQLLNKVVVAVTNKEKQIIEVVNRPIGFDSPNNYLVPVLERIKLKHFPYHCWSVFRISPSISTEELYLKLLTQASINREFDLSDSNGYLTGLTLKETYQQGVPREFCPERYRYAAEELLFDVFSKYKEGYSNLLRYVYHPPLWWRGVYKKPLGSTLPIGPIGLKRLAERYNVRFTRSIEPWPHRHLDSQLLI